MEGLPAEIVERILVTQQLTVEDVLNVAETCTRLHTILWNNNCFWKRKYEIMWPQYLKMFSDDFREWFDEVYYIYKLTKSVLAMLSTMPGRCYKKRVLFDCHFKEWEILLQKSIRSYIYITMDLVSIIRNVTPITSIEAVPVDTPGNNTLKFYATKVLMFVRQSNLEKVWRIFAGLPQEEQTLEYAATFIAQWFQPTVDVEEDDIRKQLDILALKVQKWLTVINPRHPLHEVSSKTLREWKDKNLEANQWNVSECQDIIRCLIDVLQDKCQFRENYNTSLEKNYFINEVLRLKTGLPVIVGIIYASVARRLGIKCILIGFPNYCLLKVPEFRDQPSVDYYYVDVLKEGNIIPKGTCPYRLDQPPNAPVNHLIPLCATKVAENITHRLHRYYQRSSHSFKLTNVRLSGELLQLLMPDNVDVMLDLAHLHMTHNDDSNPLEDIILTHGDHESVPSLVLYTASHKRNQIDSSLIENIPRHRLPDLKYAVGMVMKHQRMGYVCVIYDWDPTYVEGPLQKESGVYKLKHQDRQPFYKVLANGNLHYYVAEEDLVPAPQLGMLWDNDDLGRHFSHFFETHYVPNMVVEKLFPEDRPVRHSFHYNYKNM